jgi:hypothetical protein
MPDDPSRQAPTTTVDALRADDTRAAASWLVPPVIVPIFLGVLIAAQALYRLAHFGPAAFG